MSYIRISLIKPLEGHRQRVEELEQEVLKYFSDQPGFRQGFRLTSDDQIGRLTVWEDSSAANQVATSEHSIALRAQIMGQAATNVEYSFEATPT